MPRKTEPRRVKIIRHVDASGRRCASNHPGARRVEQLSDTYYATIAGRRTSLKTADLGQAWANLHRLQQRLAHEAVGIVDRWTEHARVPLDQHIKEWGEVVRAGGAGDRQASLLAGRVRKLANLAGWKRITDLNSDTLVLALARLQDAPGLGFGIKSRPGVGPATRNHYLAAVKQFARWLVAGRRLQEYPIGQARPVPTEPDIRRARREISLDDLGRLLAAAAASKVVFRGLDGGARAALYLCACSTGFRASALASLTPAAFQLDGSAPTVTMAARAQKNKRQKVQPVAACAASPLSKYMEGRQPDQPCWPGTWASGRRAAAMLRIDLEAAGIPYRVESTNGPLHFDFHALRHQYLSMGGRAGIDLRTLQALAGHSTPVLTARYMHSSLDDQARAVEKMPDLTPPAEPIDTPPPPA